MTCRQPTCRGQHVASTVHQWTQTHSIPSATCKAILPSVPIGIPDSLWWSARPDKGKSHDAESSADEPFFSPVSHLNSALFTSRDQRHRVSRLTTHIDLNKYGTRPRWYFDPRPLLESGLIKLAKPSHHRLSGPPKSCSGSRLLQVPAAFGRVMAYTYAPGSD
jgi:hypothetical protein